MARQLQQSYSQSFGPVARFPSNLNCRKSLARDPLARSSGTGSPMFHPRLQESSSSKIFRPAMSLASMEPLPQSSGPSSRMQKKGAPNKYRHGFPKKTNALSRVICRGNARRFQVSTKGRRNALGLWLGAREDAWLSGGTMTAFSVWLFGNSHTAVNYRVPLCPATHDPECQRNCLQQATAGKLQRLMQQAARRATRYFTGYLQKPQPVGRKELQQAAKNCISSTPTLARTRPGPTIARWPVACLATLNFDVPSDQSPKSSC